MLGNSQRRSSPAQQSEVSGWMVLAPPRSSTHDSDVSDVSDEEVNVSSKRKANDPLPSPRSAKNPRVSASDISAGSTRTFSSGSRTGQTSAPQPTSVRIGASGSRVYAGTQRPPVPKSHTTIGASSATQPSSHLSGPSNVPRLSQKASKPKISASQPIPSGSRSTLEKGKSTAIKSSSLMRVPATSSAPALGSSSSSTRKANSKDNDRGSSSDSLPDPRAIMSAIPALKAKDDDPKGKGKGKEVDRGQYNQAVPSSSKWPSAPKRTQSDPKSSVITPLLPDDEVLVISSDSEPEVEASLFSRTSRSATGNNPRRPSNAKEQRTKATKAYLSDSDGAIDLTSDVDTPIASKAGKGPREREREKRREKQLPKSNPTGSTSRLSPIAPRMNATTSSRSTASARISQAANPGGVVVRDLGTKPALNPRPMFQLPRPTNAKQHGSSRPSPGLPTRVPESPKDTARPLMRKENSLSHVISTSLGANSSSSSRVDKASRPRPRHSLSGPMQRSDRRDSLSKHANLGKRSAPPPPGAEIIDLCDSDDAMDVDGFDLGPGPSISTPSATATVAVPQSPATQNKDKAPGRPSYVLPPQTPTLLAASTSSSTPPLPAASVSSCTHTLPATSATSSTLPTSLRSSSVSKKTSKSPSVHNDPQPIPSANGGASLSPKLTFSGALSSTGDGLGPDLGDLPTRHISVESSDQRPQISGASTGTTLNGLLSRSNTNLVSGSPIVTSNQQSTHLGPSRSNSSTSSAREVASSSSSKQVSRACSPSSLSENLQPFERGRSSPRSATEDLVVPVADMHIDTAIAHVSEDVPDAMSSEDNPTHHESVPEDAPAVTNDTQNPVSERASPASSSGVGSIHTDSETSAPSVQRARKTTRIDGGRMPIDHSQKAGSSGTSETEDVEMQNTAITSTPSGRRTLTIKEPDFSKLRADIPDTLPDNGRLAAAIRWPAEPVPTELHDMINRLPLNYHHNPQMKHIFESMMEENTADDEPTAPRIEIYSGKGGPVTPPWEFYYTNRIFHGEGVPRSNKKKLKGCDCTGPCDPKSKTCACVHRQMAWTGGDKSIKGFLYNKKGKLLDHGYPVFECNDACECSEECMNRVIQCGRQNAISIVLTPKKGWGVFADEKIPRGTYLGIYSGEMLLESEAHERGELYDKYGRTYLFDMDFYHLRKLEEDKQKMSGKTPSTSQASKKKEERVSSTYTIDAFHVGNFTRFLNHSCDPNCQITASYVNEPDLRKPTLTIYTCRDVRQGDELTFSYFGNADDDDEEEEEEEVDEHGQKKLKVGGPSSHKNQAVHRPCLCGALNCRGQMF